MISASLLIIHTLIAEAQVLYITTLTAGTIEHFPMLLLIIKNVQLGKQWLDKAKQHSLSAFVISRSVLNITGKGVVLFV